MVSKEEIERSLKGKDDFVQIDYLRRHLKEAENLDTKKYIHLMLAGVSERKGLIKDAIKSVGNAAEMAVTFREKIDLYMKEAELNIKESDFEMADKALLNALSCANTQEKMEIQNKYLELYRIRGQILENQDKKRQAIDVYEKLLHLKQAVEKKIEAKEKLMGLYRKMGRTRDYERVSRLEFRTPPKIEFE